MLYPRGEAATVWWSPNADLSAGGAAPRLAHALEASPACLVPRKFDPRLEAALGGVDLTTLTPVNLLATASEVCTAIEEFPPMMGPNADWAWSWLRADVQRLIDLFDAASQADVLYVKLRHLAAHDLPRFATRSSPMFLVALYHGLSIAWTSRPALSVVSGTQAFEAPGHRQEVSTGTVAFLRGSLPGDVARPPAIWHPLVRDQGSRLLLTIEDGRSIPFGG